MRFAPDHNLFFVHIPKNAGQSVRNAMTRAARVSFNALASDLQVTETEAEAATEQGFRHPELGFIKPEHLPLWALNAHFPTVFETMLGASSCALARPPRDRFFSALLQRMREFGGSGAIRADDPRVIDEAARVCDFLAGNPRSLAAEYIHFTPQSDFVCLSGERIVEAVFPIRETGALARWAQHETGIHLEIEHDHARRQPKPWAKNVQPLARFVGHTLMPAAVRRAVHPLWVKSGVFATAAKGYSTIELGADVEAFIRDYYARDEALCADAEQYSARWSTPIEAATAV